MKKIFVIAVLSLALLFSLTGCWGSSSPKATATPSATATASASVSMLPESGSIASGSLWSEGSSSTDMGASGSMAGSQAGSVAGSSSASK